MGLVHQILKSSNELAARLGPVSNLLARDFQRRAVAPGRSYDERRKLQHRFFIHRTRPPYRVKLQDGFELELAADDVIQRRIMLYGPYQRRVWEPSTAELVSRLARRGGNFIMAGGHVGYFPLLFTVNAPAGAQVFTFEPNDKQRAQLAQNVALNGAKNITVQSEALFDESGKTLHFTDNTVLSSLIDGGAPDAPGAQEVRTLTIDDFAAGKKLQNLSLIFLDIEGGEPQAIAGASGFLRRSPGEAPDLIFELVPGRLEASMYEKMLGELKGLGYHLYLIDDPYDYYVAAESLPAQIRLFDLPAGALDEIARGQAALQLKDPNIFATKRSADDVRQLADIRPLSELPSA